MRKPINFQLTGVKLIKDGGLEATYRDQKTDKGITDSIEVLIKNTVNPHPDLVNKINELKGYLAKCYKMDSMIVLSNSKGLSVEHEKAFASVQKVINNVYNETMKKIAITGISLNGEIEGDKDKRSVVITGTQLMDNGSKTALNSPRIKLNSNQFMFEADVQEIINSISDEVEEYLFNNKKAQQDLFDKPEEKLSESFIEGKIGEEKPKEVKKKKIENSSKAMKVA